MNYQVGGIGWTPGLINSYSGQKRNKIFSGANVKLRERFLLKDLLKTLVVTLVLIKVLQKLPITSHLIIKLLNGLASN